MRRYMRCAWYVLAPFALYFFIVGLATQAEGQESPEKQEVRCKPQGRDFACVSIGAEHLRHLPYWVLHTPKKFTSFGLDFTARAPKKWTRLTVDFYSDLPGVDGYRACIEVALINGRAELRKPCRE